MSVAIRVERLSKYYRLGMINHGMLYKDIQSWMAKKLGKQDPHAQIGFDHFEDGADGFWALKDLNFEIQQGDRVGIIGKNGAGKSTLLKILSRITAPTEGEVRIKGRITSLLEVGTGFHGELTGRENIFLNGAILGMKKSEIARKLDEIVEFSEIGQYIDTPVKRYSSGMYVRLAFSVAAHLDSEILVADEVLAVGDAAFQKKALGKMGDLSSKEGRTVLFVSHNMAAVKQLCISGLLLEKGNIKLFDKNIKKVQSTYLGFDEGSGRSVPSWENDGSFNHRNFTPQRIRIIDSQSGCDAIQPMCPARSYIIDLEFEIRELEYPMSFEFHLFSEEAEIFATSPLTSMPGYRPQIGINHLQAKIPAGLLNIATYRLELHCSKLHEWILEPSGKVPSLFLSFVDDGNRPELYRNWWGSMNPGIHWLAESVSY